MQYINTKFYSIIRKTNWKKIGLIFLGFIAFCWFLIRVIPKPSRAAYPCQRAAFPLASAFVIWLTGLFTSSFLLLKSRRNLSKNNLVYAFGFIILFVTSIVLFPIVNPYSKLFAKNTVDNKIVNWDGNRRVASQNSNVITTFDEVGMVKSTKSDASDLDFEEIESLVRKSVELAGGISDLISNGDYVVLKPNLVELPQTPTPEFVEVSGIATDWRVVRAVARMVRELNPDGKIYIIESSSAVSTREILNYYKYTLENIPEVDQIIALEDSCGAFENYEDIHLDKVFLNDTVRLYPDNMKPNQSPEFYINKVYNNADVVISIPVLKNHKVAIITAGIKNVAIGMTPPNIYGMSESFFGKWTKIDHGYENLNKWIHDFYLCKPVDLVVVDGLQGFDHGPTGLDGLTIEEMQHNMRLIISGKKALSVDAVCGHIMSLDPTFANYMIYLDKEEYGVGTINSKFIRINGEHVSKVREVFPHNEQVVTNAIYSDYEPPTINIKSTKVEGNNVIFDIESDDDLNKVELKVNGVLLHQICIDNFSNTSFEVNEELLPIDSLTLVGYDRFFNETKISIDYSAIDESESFIACLNQNYPNPFSSTTSLSFELRTSTHVTLYVTDLKGNIVDMIVNKKLPTGNYQYIWDKDVASGIYLCNLACDGKKLIKKMLKK
ncbi:MAG: hypothetical protein A2W85_01890 [Bacteroidetes bacterium GWF2_41_31]|nr:MAG: hypothetical protein A2W85_01890 [Bacteroidetes bacterium GWF2_41_31]OFZ08654.1 MAG: hypothetical protein A2338_10510 [Bacteroidetes bacterium RIFOXYB12_FULL_41_6]